MRIRWDELIKLMSPKLSRENFIAQVVEHGYFAEQFPTCFSSKIFARKLNNLLRCISCSGKKIKKEDKTTLPTTLSSYKNDISRRILSLPNPKAFLRLAVLMQENWDEIQEFAESPNSLSPITYIHKYKSSQRASLNSENLRESQFSKSDFVDGIRNCIEASLGYNYRLKLDISNCYNSIYTHSIAWAVCGKAQAKEYRRTKQPSALQPKYDLADKLDSFIRYQKNNETNGILVGPFTSRIFSEIILAAIDKALDEEGYQFRRYVDDYKFYFRTDSEAQANLPKIERILNEYNLNINTEKIEIIRFPFEVISQIKEIFDTTLQKAGVFGVLNAASQLYSNGEKGAFKYALKYIKNKKPTQDDFTLVISSLINIMILEPKCGRYIIAYFKKHMYSWKKDIITELINNELSNSISNELQEEALLFLQIIKELKLSLSARNLIYILGCSNDFAIIVALDIWKSRKSSVIRTPGEARKINQAIEQLCLSLQGEQYSGARWLLLYEMKIHGLVPLGKQPTPNADSFFDEMYYSKVTFYQSIGRKLYYSRR